MVCRWFNYQLDFSFKLVYTTVSFRLWSPLFNIRQPAACELFVIWRYLLSNFPRFKVTGWALDGQSTGSCTGEPVVGVGCFKKLFFVFYLYRHYNKEVLTVGNFNLSQMWSGVGGSWWSLAILSLCRSWVDAVRLADFIVVLLAFMEGEVNLNKYQVS